MNYEKAVMMTTDELKDTFHQSEATLRELEWECRNNPYYEDGGEIDGLYAVLEVIAYELDCRIFNSPRNVG